MRVIIPLPGATAPSLPRTPHCRGFTITLRRTTIGRTPLEELSVRRGELYLTTHNTHTRQAYMPPAGYEPAIPASERPYTHVLDRAALRSSVRTLLPVLTNWPCCCCCSLTHIFSESNANLFPLTAKLFLCSRDLELRLQHDSKCKSYSPTL